MSATQNERNERILLIDDNPAIHADFRKVLGGVAEAAGTELGDMEAALFGDDEPPHEPPPAAYEMVSAMQGAEALELVRQAREEGRPFAMAFVDVRMPPGWDGVETIRRMWEVDPDLQAVICTAYSDYTWSETIAKLGRSDRLLVLKKPFDPVEACQIACALVEKWNVTARERLRLEEVRAAEQEARSYAASLETVNRALETTLATAEESSRAKSEFLMHLTDELLQPVAELIESAEQLGASSASSDQWLEILGAICREGGALRTTLSDIVDLSHSQAGGLSVRLGSCDPFAVVDQTVREVGATAQARSGRLELACTTPIPVSIRTDEGRLRRIVDHLLRNALRRSERGTVRVRLSLERTPSWQEPLLRVDVLDDGPPIPKSQVGLLFEPFQGAGDGSLGLSLSRRIALELGGDLRVESELEQGTCFSLTLGTGALDGVAMIAP